MTDTFYYVQKVIIGVTSNSASGGVTAYKPDCLSRLGGMRARVRHRREGREWSGRTE